METLSQIFSSAASPLYLVGGYVRDCLLDRSCSDLDVCSDLPPADVCSMLEGTGFSIPQSNMPLGTLIIVSGDFKCEYTCFRTESYRTGGGHTPESVIFPASIKDDALRRDFTVNALYFDIQKAQILDPLGEGLSDLAQGIIRTTRNPRDVFGEDPLRIMRLCRIAGGLGFTVEEKTLQAASALSHLVGTLTRHRIGDEFLKQLEGGGAGLALLYDTGAASVVSPCITKDACNIADGANLALPVALAMLFASCGAEPASHTMQGLAIPVNLAALAAFLIKNEDYSNTNSEDLKLDIAKMGSERAHCLASFLEVSGSAFAEHFRSALESLMASGAPMSMQELKLTGNDIIKSLGAAPGPKLGSMLNDAFCYAVLHPEKNTAESLIQYLSNGLDP